MLRLSSYVFFFFYIFLFVAVAFSLFFFILRIPFCAAAAVAAAACAPEVPAPDIMGPARSHKWKPSEGHDKSARASMRELRAAEVSRNRQGKHGTHEEKSKSKSKRRRV